MYQGLKKIVSQEEHAERDLLVKKMVHGIIWKAVYKNTQDNLTDDEEKRIIDQRIERIDRLYLSEIINHKNTDNNEKMIKSDEKNSYCSMM